MRRFIELTIYETSRHILIDLDDITSVEEGNKNPKDYCMVYTKHDTTIPCIHENYAMLKHYLDAWVE